MTVQATAADAGSGATFDASINSISHTEFWEASNTGTFTSGTVSLARVAIGSVNIIGSASAQGGSYTSIGGSFTNKLIASNTITAGTASGSLGTGTYFVLANLPGPVITSVSSNSNYDSGSGTGVNNGYTGSTITITGTNLSGVTTLTINGNNAGSIGTNTATTITFTLGTAVTSGGIISVTNGIGTGTFGGFSYLGYITNAASSSDYNNAGAWLSGSLPPIGANTTVNNSGITISGASNSPTILTVNSGASLNINNSSGAITATTITNNGTLTFSAAGSVTATTVTNGGTLSWTAAGTLNIAATGILTNNSTFTQGSGIVAFAGAGTVNGFTAITFNNLIINTGTVTLPTGGTLPTIGGTLTINGGQLSTAPDYGGSSLLLYNSGGTYSRNVEWSTTSGAGYPQNVQISSNTTVDLSANSPANNFQCAGNLTVDNGSTLTLNAIATKTLTVTGNASIAGTLTLSTNATPGALTITGNISGAGTLTLGTHGGGDCSIGGNWSFSGTLNTNSRAVTFNGGSPQQINNTASFAYLTISSSGGVTLNGVNIIVSNQLNLSSGTLTLGSGNTITMNGGSTVAQTSGSLASGNGAGTFTFSGTGTVSGTVGFYNVNISNGVDFGTGSTINGTLSINAGGYVNNSHPPTYAGGSPGSSLKYNTTGTYGRGSEWSTTSGAGYPFNVEISNNTTLDLGNGGAGTARQMAGSLTIDAGSTFSTNVTAMTATLTILGNINNGTGTLTLSSSPGADLYVGGNWNFTGILNDNTRAVFFNGGSAQAINDAATFSYPIFSGGHTTSINVASGIIATNPLEINSGSTLQFGLAYAINSASSNLKLNNGILSTGASAGYSGTMGTVNLADNSTIALGSGSHSLNFANSSAVAWTSAKTLTITGWTGTSGNSGTSGQIFFGTDNTGLTTTQLSQITFTGFGTNHAIILSTGEIVPCISATTPSLNATSASFTNVGGISMNFSWTSGNGADRIVVVKSGSAVSDNPVNGTVYSANSAFGSGGTIGTGEYVVYNGAGTNVTVTGLTVNTTYYFTVFEYNGSACSISYFTTTPLSAHQATANGFPTAACY